MSYAMRKLGPDGLGVAGLPMSIVSLLGLTTNLGYDALLPKFMARADDLGGRREIAGRYYSLRLLLVLFCLPLMLAIWLGASRFAPSQTSLEHGWVWLAAYAVLFCAALNPQPVSQGLDRLRQFGNAQFASSLVMAGLFVSLMSLWPSAQVFLAIQAIGMLTVAVIVFCLGPVTIPLRPRWDLLAMLPGHVREAWPMMLNVIVIFGLYTSDGVFLAFFASHYEIGLYGSAMTLCNAANAFIALLPAVLFPRMIVWHRESPERMLRISGWVAVAILVATPMIYLAALAGAEFGLPLLLGERFVGASHPFAALISCFFIGVAYAIVSSALVLIDRQKVVLVMSGAGAMIALVVYPMLAPFGAGRIADGKLGVVTLIFCVSVLVLFREWTLSKKGNERGPN